MTCTTLHLIFNILNDRFYFHQNKNYQKTWIIIKIHLKLKGVDTSDFSGAVEHGAREGLSGRGLEGGAREWYQTDADGYLVVPYSHTADYPEPEKLIAGMDGMTNDLMPCMRMEYVPRDQLRIGFK